MATGDAVMKQVTDRIPYMLVVFNPQKAGVREIFMRQRKIPVRPGRYHRDLDIIEELCNPEFIFTMKWRKAREHRRWQARRGLTKRANRGSLKLPSLMAWKRPMGVDIRDIPQGVITIYHQITWTNQYG